MKISLEWLSEFVDWNETDPDVIADRLTLASAETEGVEQQGKLLEHCCVGKIVSVAKHPNADKLSLCDVETDQGTKRVVCGGTNLREGQLVAFAHVGATVKWHGGELMTLQPVKIRGEESSGMICAAEELDLGDRFPAKPEHGERPIVDLSDSGLKPKQKLREALGLNDTIFHFSNTAITNRPDLFSHIGFARECVALGLATWKKGQPAAPKIKEPKDEISPYTIEAMPGLVPAYAACALHIDAVGETPEWMKKRLAAVGTRSISLPVDITNYVMWECGMPMHAFDRAQIQGQNLKFRESARGETVTTLDEKKHVLPEGAIVLGDDAGIFDLCGIMGGARSASNDSMTEVYLHAPVYDAVRIRRAVQATGHRSDASTIFEKSVPPASAQDGLMRALKLFLDLCPGARITSSVILEGDIPKTKPLSITLETLQSAMGVEISAKEATAILERLDCEVKTKKTAKETTLSVTPPPHRVRDLKIPEDIIDEVSRIYGFDRIPETMPNAPMRITDRDTRLHRLRESLKNDDYMELLPLSLLGSELLKKSGMDDAHAVRISNPLGEDMALMQTSTLPALLTHAEKNLLLSNGSLKTFHWGHVFSTKNDEHTELSILHSAKEETGLTNDPFLLTKQSLTTALQAMGYAASFIPAKASPAYAHPGRYADVVVAGVTVGSVFELHPSVRERFGIAHRTGAAQVNMTALMAIEPTERMAKAVAQFPAVSYDVTLPWRQDKAVGELLAKLRNHSQLLEHVEVADLYRGKQHQPKEYNLTLRFTYRAPDRTLTEDEAKKEHERLLQNI